MVFCGVLVIGTVMAFVFYTEIFGENSVFNQTVSQHDVLNTLSGDF